MHFQDYFRNTIKVFVKTLKVHFLEAHHFMMKGKKILSAKKSLFHTASKDLQKYLYLLSNQAGHYE